MILEKGDKIRIKIESRDKFNDRMFCGNVFTVEHVIGDNVYIQENPNECFNKNEIELVKDYYFLDHSSDCERHNEPAYPNKPCTCGLNELGILANSVLMRILSGDAHIDFNTFSGSERESKTTHYDFMTVVKEHQKRKDTYYYKHGIKLFMTPEDFKFLWFRDKAYALDRPSIDRIDPKGHYTLDNCRYIELLENIYPDQPAKGEATNKNKLTREKVIEIRKSNKNHSALAREYNVAPITIKRVRVRESWKHVA
jgi:hypothetical protein